MHTAAVKLEIYNINKQIEQHESAILRLKDYPNSVIVEKTMMEAAKRKRDKLQAKIK